MSSDDTTSIRRLELGNYRLFRSLNVEFHPRLTVLVAPNGRGKTAALSAIGLAFSPFVDVLASQYARGIEIHDIRHVLNAQDGNMERALPAFVKVEGAILGKAAEWSLTRDSDRPRAKRYRAEDLTDVLLRATNLRKAVVDAAEGRRPTTPDLPLVAAYGTSRVWDGGENLSPRRTKRQDTSRFLGYADCLEPTASFAFFERWFRDMNEAAVLETATGTSSLHRPAERLAAIDSVVTPVLRDTGWGHLHWDAVGKEVVASHKSLGRLPVSWLSDGIKSVLAMAADLTHRCVRLNPHFGVDAAARTSGIVLIDEVDMHLHPEWQQTILASLTSAFPRMQFIVTTHSPQVLTTVDAASIRVLHVEDGDGSLETPSVQTLGVQSQDVLARIMRVSPTPDVEAARVLSHYKGLIQQGLGGGEEAARLRSRLDAHFGARHPVVVECDRLAKLQALKPRMSEGSGT